MWSWIKVVAVKVLKACLAVAISVIASEAAKEYGIA